VLSSTALTTSTAASDETLAADNGERLVRNQIVFPAANAMSGSAAFHLLPTPSVPQPRV